MHTLFAAMQLLLACNCLWLHWLDAVMHNLSMIKSDTCTDDFYADEYRLLPTLGWTSVPRYSLVSWSWQLVPSSPSRLTARTKSKHCVATCACCVRPSTCNLYQAASSFALSWLVPLHQANPPHIVLLLHCTLCSVRMSEYLYASLP